MIEGVCEVFVTVPYIVYSFHIRLIHYTLAFSQKNYLRLTTFNMTRNYIQRYEKPVPIQGWYINVL